MGTCFSLVLSLERGFRGCLSFRVIFFERHDRGTHHN